MKQLAVWIVEGKIKSENTIIKGGLQKAEEALVGLFNGINKGTVVSLSSSLTSYPRF